MSLRFLTRDDNDFLQANFMAINLICFQATQHHDVHRDILEHNLCLTKVMLHNTTKQINYVIRITLHNFVTINKNSFTILKCP